MKQQDQIKALAELDGWNDTLGNQAMGYHPAYRWHHLKSSTFKAYPPPYLTSYDAIIPLIQKWALGNAIKEADFIFQLNRVVGGVFHEIQTVGFTTIGVTPSQLSEALLQATGKWIK